MTAARYCLAVVYSVAAKHGVSEDWRDVMSTCHQLCLHTIDVALQVLGGKVHDDEGGSG